MKIAIALILVTLAVPAQADIVPGMKCLDTECENIAFNVVSKFVRFSVAKQTKEFTTLCEYTARFVAMHKYADGTHAELKTCTFRYKGKDIIWNDETVEGFAEPLFSTEYLYSIELR